MKSVRVLVALTALVGCCAIAPSAKACGVVSQPAIIDQSVLMQPAIIDRPLVQSAVIDAPVATCNTCQPAVVEPVATCDPCMRHRRHLLGLHLPFVGLNLF